MSIKCPKCGADHSELIVRRTVPVNFDVNNDGTPSDMITTPQEIFNYLRDTSLEDSYYTCCQCDTQFKVKTCGFCCEYGIYDHLAYHILTDGWHDEVANYHEEAFRCNHCGGHEVISMRDEWQTETLVAGKFKECTKCEEEIPIYDLEDGMCSECRKSGGTITHRE